MVALIWSQDHYEVSRFHERQFAHMLCMNNSTKIQPNIRATQERQKKKTKNKKHKYTVHWIEGSVPFWQTLIVTIMKGFHKSFPNLPGSCG